ncbi:hypothetical protein U9M48_008691 [Paspalum notatum var. saurae]|uniref:Uncharacterized protein n=1 Tax=Paspalum notatum var. saurae TaxID=547442 RepID=A0AAQ3SQ63_PASNO
MRSLCPSSPLPPRHPHSPAPALHAVARRPQCHPASPSLRHRSASLPSPMRRRRPLPAPSPSLPPALPSGRPAGRLHTALLRLHAVPAAPPPAPPRAEHLSPSPSSKWATGGPAWCAWRCRHPTLASGPTHPRAWVRRNPPRVSRSSRRVRRGRLQRRCGGLPQCSGWS